MSKYRLEFSKRDKMRYIGHLDLLKIFQRAVKRSGLPIAYSKGFNPHQIMGFAVPLPLGAESTGECIDMEFTEDVSETSIKDGLNDVFPDGLRICAVRKFRENEKSAAATVAAADYDIIFDFKKTEFKGVIKEIMSLPEINIEKTSKKKTKTVDIRKNIFSAEAETGGEKDILKTKISTGSAENLKPDLLAEFIYKYMGMDYDPYSTEYIRKKLYKEENGKFIPLMS